MHSGELSVFVDESGKPTLSDVDTDPWYVLVAVIVQPQDLPAVQECIAVVASRYFAGGEVKSSAVKGNDTRRLQVLQDLCDAPWTYVSIAVRKSAIRAEAGLRFKPVFHKFMSRMLIENLRRTAVAIRVRQDTYGTEDFMAASSEYMQNRVEPDLWFSLDHGFATPQEESGIQLADFIAGSLRRWVADEVNSEAAGSAIRSMLLQRMVLETSWPSIDGPSIPSDEAEPAEAAMRGQLLRTARSTWDALAAGASVEEQQMAAVLDALAMARLFDHDGQQARTATELMTMLNRLALPCPSDQVFRASVIGGLRDRGVVIAGNRTGYRLALDPADIDVYLQHTGNVLLPMLHRLSAARTAIMVADPGFAARLSANHGRLAAVLEAYLDHIARD